MTNPTIEVNLDSLDAGTVPTVTGSISVNEGDNLDISVTWPSSGSDFILCELDFSASKNQDPFNDTVGGKTEFPMTRASSGVAAVYTLTIESDATVTTDTYDLILTIDGKTYTKDPTIIVDKN